MKKKIYVLLLVTLIVFSFGCQKEDKYSKYTRIAILSNEETNNSKILFMDDEHTVIYELESEYVDEVVYFNDKLFIGNDKNNYQTIDCINIAFSEDIYVKEGRLLYYLENGSYAVYLDGKCNVFDAGGNKKELEGYLLNYLVTRDYFYMVDYSNYLYCYSISDFSLLSKNQLFNSEYISLTEVEGKSYIVSSKGFTLIDQGKATETYVYPYDFNDVLNVKKDIIVVRENNEQVIYRVSFDEHRMKLEPIYDEIYYISIKYAKKDGIS
ncbi:MAG TPA: hypothetical protein PLI19_06925, partial [Erysipelotrichaceae bacterium]|nr:hypothetical protein [Erysipelotrichaceae bacterium]